LKIVGEMCGKFDNKTFYEQYQFKKRVSNISCDFNDNFICYLFNRVTEIKFYNKLIYIYCI